MDQHAWVPLSISSEEDCGGELVIRVVEVASSSVSTFQLVSLGVGLVLLCTGCGGAGSDQSDCVTLVHQVCAQCVFSFSYLYNLKIRNFNLNALQANFNDQNKT